MSMHWNPDQERGCAPAPAPSGARAAKAWPEGATAGLLLVAAGCLALGVILYEVAGPRVVVEDEARAD